MFIDRKYLQRNAAVALGNYGDPQYLPVLIEALETQHEDMVRGYACMGAGPYRNKNSKKRSGKKFKN